MFLKIFFKTKHFTGPKPRNSAREIYTALDGIGSSCSRTGQDKEEKHALALALALALLR